MDIKSAPELAPFLLENVERRGIILGAGSFGSIEEVVMNGAVCAGKRIHDSLIQPQNVHRDILKKKIVEECHIMSALKHPNVVQFFGLCFFENSKFPVIVMEKLFSNLDSFLTSHTSISMPLKSIIMQDIAKGLNYIHSQVPPIVHRDLTARNVLITSAMTAKLADLGNARIMQSHGLSNTLSQFPGTLVYMPPEALELKPSYNTSLDIFSLGHLMLFMVLQESPVNLLPSTYQDHNKLKARTELERRSKYMDRAKEILEARDPILQIIARCLNDFPDKRPGASEVLQILMKKEIENEDVYDKIRTKINVNVPHVLKEEGELEVASPLEFSTEDMDSQKILTQIKSGEPMFLSKYELVKQGLFGKKEKQWKTYAFCLEDSTHLRYYGDINKKPQGEIPISSISVVVRSRLHDSYTFEVHFDGKGSPWTIRAYKMNIKNCWMEVLSPSNLGNIAEATPQKVQEQSEEARYVHHQLNANSEVADYEEICIPCVRKKPDTQKPPKSLAPDSPPDIGWKSGCATPLPNQLKDLSEAQLELLASMLNEVLTQRQKEVVETKTEKGTEKGNETPEKKDDLKATIRPVSKENNEGGIHPDKSIKIDNAQAPPLPPKKRRFLEAGLHDETPKTSAAELSEPDKAPFRSRVKVESRRRATIKRIIKYRTQLTDNMNDISESGKEQEDTNTPQWSRAKSSQAAYKLEDETLPKELFLDKSSIKDLTLIGVGNFGRVSKGTLVAYGNESIEVAVKTVIHKTEKDREDFQREMAIMSKMVHPNIVRLYGLITGESLIVLEYMSKGDLKTFLMNNDRPVGKLVKFMVDVAMGMHYLSKMGLIHGDLAARNILVSEDEVSKVADFGHLRELPKDGDKVLIKPQGTKVPIRWCAPEYLNERKCSSASDVWSYGVLLWEMANPTKLPYQGFSNADAATKIKSGHTLIIPYHYPTSVQNVMMSCWKTVPESRPSFFYISMLLTKIDI